jgi:hypothetical protein
MLPTLEMEGAVLDPGVEPGKAGAAHLAFLELRLIVCHMLRIRPVVLWGRQQEVARSARATLSLHSVSETVATGVGVPCFPVAQQRVLSASTSAVVTAARAGAPCLPRALAWSMRKLRMCSARPRNQCSRDALEHDRQDVAPLSAAAELSSAASAASDT